MRIENTLFVQLLVGGRLEREGVNAKILSSMVLITLALAPVALLLLIQIMFLTYHSQGITWLHRVMLALDNLVVWTLWRGYRINQGTIHLKPTTDTQSLQASVDLFRRISSGCGGTRFRLP